MQQLLKDNHFVFLEQSIKTNRIVWESLPERGVKAFVLHKKYIKSGTARIGASICIEATVFQEGGQINKDVDKILLNLDIITSFIFRGTTNLIVCSIELI